MCVICVYFYLFVSSYLISFMTLKAKFLRGPVFKIVVCEIKKERNECCSTIIIYNIIYIDSCCLFPLMSVMRFVKLVVDLLQFSLNINFLLLLCDREFDLYILEMSFSLSETDDFGSTIYVDVSCGFVCEKIKETGSNVLCN